MKLTGIAKEIWEKKYRFNNEASIEATWERVASTLADAEKVGTRNLWTERFYQAMEDFKFIPAGRILAGAGTGRDVTLFNCFVMGTIPDSMDGIFSNLREAALTMQQGGGIGYDFSTLRPKGMPVRGVSADASGPLSFMDVWDAMCRTVMSAGSRRGAMMATMRCDHPDIEAFVAAKADPARLRMFNLSVLVTDGFMSAVYDDEFWDLMWEGKKIKTIKARDLWNQIMRNTYDHAEPGVIFIDRINDANNLKYCETISATNPCGEQPLPPYGACLLGSINLAKMIAKPFSENAYLDSELVCRTVKVAVRMLDNVIDVSKFPLKAQHEEAHAKRRIGLGVTGLADALTMLRQRYGSDESLKTIDNILRLITVTAYGASSELAKEKGQFPAFVADKFLGKGTFASTLPFELRICVKKFGIRNSHLMSIAPTGTISLLAGNVSSGVEPIFNRSYTRKVLEKDGSKSEHTVKDYALEAYHSIAGPGADIPDYFVTTDDLLPLDHLRVQATAQRWIDSSISKTINLPENISFEDFKNVYLSAYNIGCKGCTTYRPNKVTGSVLSMEPDPLKEVKFTAEDMSDAANEAIFMDRKHMEELKAVGGKETYANHDPMARPETLAGVTTKIKMGDTDAIYVTITDMQDSSGVRPFEVFVSTKNPQHFAWSTALMRMISAIFRRPHDARFVVEELKSSFDPSGGGFWRGKYWHSPVAAIGAVIEEHMDSIGYNVAPRDVVHVSTVGSFPVAEAEEPSEFKLTGTGLLCLKCHSSNIRHESGCFTCADCGHSSCG